MEINSLLLNISLLLFFVYFYKKIRHGLHILQLENYYNDRYAVWLKNNVKTVLDVKVIGLMVIPIIIFAIRQNEYCLYSRNFSIYVFNFYM